MEFRDEKIRKNAEILKSKAIDIEYQIQMLKALDDMMAVFKNKEEKMKSGEGINDEDAEEMYQAFIEHRNKSDELLNEMLKTKLKINQYM